MISSYVIMDIIPHIAARLDTTKIECALIGRALLFLSGDVQIGD
jgi:hypothetical protein